MMTWLLTVIFLFPYVVKSTHFFQYEHGCHSDTCHTEENSQQKKEHAAHDCITCLICKITFSSFTETDPFDKIEIPQTQNIRISTGYDEDIYIPSFTSHYLRAPPCRTPNNVDASYA